MFKKIAEPLLILLFSLSLAGALAVYLEQTQAPENEKSQLQHSLENSAHRWNDLFYSIQDAGPPSESVVLVAVDDASLIEIGRWPWSRNVINQLTQQLLKFEAKTISFDIFFSEKETKTADEQFVLTVSKNPEKFIFGTYSRSQLFLKPYQDYCLTQAFLYTGGDNLVKINPFFAILDTNNPYEEISFNSLFDPIFKKIDTLSENEYLAQNSLSSLASLNTFQTNSLNYYKKSRVYEYCGTWLTSEDRFDMDLNPELKKTYFSIFSAVDDDHLKKTLADFKSQNFYNPIPQYVMWLQNITELQKAAKYTASLVSLSDHDGTVRSYPLTLRTGNQLGTSYIPSLALQTYLAATGCQSQIKIDVVDGQKKVTSLEIVDVSENSEKLVTSVPTDQEGKLLINFYGKQNTFPYISAKELLSKSENIKYYVLKNENGRSFTNEFTVNKKDFLRDKNVIIGATAVGIWDIKTTPNDINYPGPEIHATVLSNLLNQKFLSYSTAEHRYAPLILFIFIFYNLFVLIKMTARFGLFYFPFTFLALIYFQFQSFSSGVLYNSSFLFIVLYSLAYFLTYIYKYFFQFRKSNQIKKAFSRYVSKDIVEEILKNESSLELRGQKLHMSVLFSDIRGFTSFSENMDAVEIAALLNQYFTPMSDIITANQGTIDKYIGDAIMAMFGAPLNYKDHATKACLAALQSIEQLKVVNAAFLKNKWPQINIGIGINSGHMNAGNIGSKTIQNYTVIGDSVNLAARIQALNKEYGTQIIISEYTYELVKSQFNCREIDEVAIRGRIEKIRIYELTSLKK